MYIVVDDKGNIISYTDNQTTTDGIYINDDSLWAQQIRSAPNDYKFIYENLEHFPRPSVYHSWTGTEWVLDQAILSAAKADMWERIKVKRQDQQYLGVKITTVDGEFWIHSDEPSRSLHLGMVGAAILHILRTNFGATSLPAFPSDLTWKTMQKYPNGQPVFILLDYVKALQIFAADKDMTAQCFTAAEMHRIQMEASADPLNYNYHVGWPPVFEG